MNAALRLPDDDFWTDQRVVDEYVNVTLAIYEQYVGLKLVQQPCDHDPEKWVLRPSKTQQIGWDGANATQRQGFADFCAQRCHCSLPGGSRPGLQPCRDGPDRPPLEEYCSLCGPKLNEPIDVYFYYPVAPPAPL